MELLKDRILKFGKIFPGNILKVDSFLNHQIDVGLLAEMGKEFFRLFEHDKVNKILTIESSGIGIAAFVAKELNAPMVFAKKSHTANISDTVYTSKAMSYTHGKVYDILVSKEYLHATDRVLIIDDFLANGAALTGLIDIVRQADATLIGCGIAIEKGFQGGGDHFRSSGIRVESLAIVESMSDSGLLFR